MLVNPTAETKLQFILKKHNLFTITEEWCHIMKMIIGWTKTTCTTHL